MTATLLSRFRAQILLGALVFGLGIRLIPIVHNQIFFWFDQGLDIALVKRLVVDHDVSLVGRYSSSQGVLMGPLWTWILAVPFVLGQGNPAVLSLFFSLVSLVSAVATYKIVSRILNSAVGLVTSLLTIFAPVYIFSSLVVASPHPVTFLFIFYLWFLYEIVVKDRRAFWIPLGVLLGIFFQLEIAVGIFCLPGIVFSFLAFRGMKQLFSRELLGGAVLFLATFLPQLFFDLRHDFLISRGFIDVILGKSSSLYTGASPLLDRLVERALSFWEDFGRMALYTKNDFATIVTLFLVGIGWIVILRRRLTAETAVLKLLLITLGSFYLGFSLYKGPLWEWYRVGLPIVYILLLAIPLGFLLVHFRLLRIPIVLLLAGYIVSGSNPRALERSLANSPIDDNAILQNQLTAIDYVYQHAAGREFSSFAYTPPVYDYVWQYHYFWYGKEKYGYLPRNWQLAVPLLGIGTQSRPPSPTEGLFYVILEPHRERPWEPSGWLESYIKYGQITDRRQFPGDIIVEERQTL